MKKLLLNTALGALTLGLASFASPMTNSALAQETAAPAAAKAVETVDVDPALWVVKDDDTTIYMFGTVHILRKGLSWFDEDVKKAFDASDELVIEVIEPEPTKMQEYIGATAVDRTGTTLRSRMNDEDKAAYEKAMTNLGMPVGAFDQFEPWFAAITLSLLPSIKAGYDLNSGAEKVLTAQAKKDGKKIGQLETVEYQLGLFDNLPMDGQLAFLKTVVDSSDDVTEQLDSLVTQWGNGNPDELAEIMNEGFEGHGQLRDALLIRRNAAWSRWIDERLDAPGTVFIAVGAGHLAGEGSVQEMLKMRDIETARIDY